MSFSDEDLIYAPPWREWIVDEWRGGHVCYRWREYGPIDTIDFAKQKARWLERREGGGLWDDGEDLAQRVRSGQMGPPRDARVSAYVRANSASIPPRELECYLLIWEEGLGQMRAAKRMGVSRSTVQSWMRRLTARVSE